MSFAKTACGVALPAIVVVLALLGSRSGTQVTESAAEPPRGAARAPQAPVAEPESPAAVSVAEPRAERVTLELDAPRSLAAVARVAELGLQLRQRATREPAAQDPADLLRTLEDQLRRRPADAPRVLEELRHERDLTRVFVKARALGPHLEAPELRRQALDVLGELPAGPRAAGLVVLLGRSEPEVVAFAIDQLERERDATLRGRAASLLAHVEDDLPADQVEQAQRAARQLLQTSGSSAEAVAGAADLLGSPRASEGDRALLLSSLDEARDPSALSSLVLGLCESGVDVGLLQARLTQIEDRPDNTPALRRVIEHLRSGLAGRG